MLVFFQHHPAPHSYSYTQSQLEVPQFSHSPVLQAALLEQLWLSVQHKGSSETEHSKRLLSFIPGPIFPIGLGILTSDLADTRLLFSIPESFKLTNNNTWKYVGGWRIAFVTPAENN